MILVSLFGLCAVSRNTHSRVIRVWGVEHLEFE